jgi:His/Glu/Gln/Arg/opine family amino acid ABC transporter permease subunit
VSPSGRQTVGDRASSRAATTDLTSRLVLVRGRDWSTSVGIAIIAAAVGAGALAAVDWEYVAALDAGVVWEYRSTLLRGFAVTLAFTVAGLSLGILLGTMLAMLAQASFAPVRWLVAAYVEFWRNTPLLVQLIWIHFALPLITGVQTSVNQSGLLGVTLNTGAYYTEIVRSGIGAIPRGQWEAARALGLPRWITWGRIILPQAVRIIIPPTTNMSISVFKATAILSILNVGELMREVVRISNYTYKPVEFYSAAAVMYAVVGLLISRLAKRVERRFEHR